jgi:hypothetical protein
LGLILSGGGIGSLIASDAESSKQQYRQQAKFLRHASILLTEQSYLQFEQAMCQNCFHVCLFCALLWLSFIIDFRSEFL